ncbi:MAG: PAS domain S-box protein [Aggregatilineales bacterium]
MTLNQANVSGRLSRLWTRITEPSPALADPIARYDARLLTAALLAFGALYWLTSLARIALQTLAPPYVTALLASTVSLFSLYALSRTPRFRLAIWALNIYIIAVMVTVFVSDAELALRSLFPLYLMLAVIFTGLVLSVRATALTAAAALALTALLIAAYPLPDSETEVHDVVQLSAIIAGISVTLAAVQRHNRRVIARHIQDLAEREASQRALFAALSDPVIVHCQGIIARVNPAFETVFGYAEAEVVGQPAIPYAAPESRALIAEKAQSQGVERYEILALRRDGTALPIEISSRPYVHNGQHMRVSVLRDISARKAAEQALVEERNLLQAVINAIPDQVYVKDTESRFILVNQALLQRYNMQRPDEVLGKTDFDLFSPEMAQRFYDDEQALMAASQPTTLTFESFETLPDLTPVWLQVKKAPLRDSAGRVIGVLGVNRDITERRQAEERRLALALERQHGDILRRFIAGLSHDLNTPLTALKTGLYLLRRKLDEPAQRQRHLDSFEEQVNRLAALVAELLDLNRLERRTEPIDRAPVLLEALLAPVIAEAQTLTTQRGQSFTATIEPGLPPLVINAELLRQALHNLVVNAALYTPPAGAIALEARRANTHVDIAVRDTGVGIEPDEQARIFEGFYRGDKARSAHTGRAGLGLTIARRIALAHGGDIAVTSAPGAGSTFTLRLPLEPEPA